MGQITKEFAQQMLGYCERGNHAPLTAWEETQLLTAWLQREALEQQRDKLLAALKLAVDGRNLSDAHNLITEVESTK